METEKTVEDGKMSNEKLGSFHRRVDEIKRRINEGTLNYSQVMKGLQLIIQNQIFGNLKITTVPFNPVSFIGNGWSKNEEDERSSKLKEIDFSQVKFIHCLKDEESSIKGKEFLKRLKERNEIRLGANAFMALWNDYKANKENSIIERLYQEGKIKRWLYFFGTILSAPLGNRCVLYLCRFDDGGWDWGAHWLGSDWGVEYLAALLQV